MGTLLLGPAYVFPVKYSYETIKDTYYALSGNKITVLIERYLKINIKAFVLGIMRNLITLVIINLFLNKSNYVKEPIIFKDIIKIEKEVKTYTSFREDLYNYFNNLKDIFKKIVTRKTDTKEKLSILGGRIIGNLGAQEEYIFREFLIELLNTKIKIPTERLLKKIFNKSNNIDQKINGIYLVLETFLSGCAFGLAHLYNLSHSPKEDVFRQVFLCTFGGFYYNIIKSINPNIYLVWLIHYYSNFLSTTVLTKTIKQFQK